MLQLTKSLIILLHTYLWPRFQAVLHVPLIKSQLHVLHSFYEHISITKGYNFSINKTHIRGFYVNIDLVISCICKDYLKAR